MFCGRKFAKTPLHFCLCYWLTAKRLFFTKYKAIIGIQKYRFYFQNKLVKVKRNFCMAVPVNTFCLSVIFRLYYERSLSVSHDIIWRFKHCHVITIYMNIVCKNKYATSFKKHVALRKACVLPGYLSFYMCKDYTYIYLQAKQCSIYNIIYLLYGMHMSN